MKENKKQQKKIICIEIITVNLQISKNKINTFLYNCQKKSNHRFIFTFN